MKQCTPDRFNYRSTKDNVINYLTLLISLLLTINIKDDKRIFIVLIVSTIVQLLICCFITCRGISIIYCFLFGFIIKYYRDKQNYKTSNRLIILIMILLILSGTSLIKTKGFMHFILFMSYHILFVIGGSVFTFIPINPELKL